MIHIKQKKQCTNKNTVRNNEKVLKIKAGGSTLHSRFYFPAAFKDLTAHSGVLIFLFVGFIKIPCVFSSEEGH